MSKHSIFNFQRIVNAFGYSCLGFKSAWKNEAAIRQEVIAGLFFLPAAFLLADSGVELALLLLSMGLVFFAELVNTAIEFTIDRIGKEIHPLAGQAKDVGSSLVFVALVLMGLVWGCIILYPN